MDITRRDFIKLTGAAALTVGGLSMLTAGSEPMRQKCMKSTDNNQSTLPISKKEREILTLASLASSGHNTQPWTVTVEKPGSWIIGTDKNRWLPMVDPENRETMLSLGAFIRTLTLAAGIHGYRTVVTPLTNNRFSPSIARVRLIKSTKTAYPVKRITQRRTIRKGMLKREIKRNDIDFLIGRNRDTVIYLPFGSSESRYLAENTVEANRVQAWRDSAQEELSNWIRWKDDTAAEHCNGLTPASMEITGIAGWIVKKFYTRKSVMKKGFREQTVDLVKDQVSSFGGWIIVTSKNSSTGTLLETGGLYADMTQKMRERMIAAHPMSQVLEEEPFRDEIGRNTGISDTVQFVLRIGYLDTYPDPVSLRMPLERFVS